MPYSTGNASLSVKIYAKEATGLALKATIDAGTPPEEADIFAKGCELLDLDTGTYYLNVGTSAEPSWESQ